MSMLGTRVARREDPVLLTVGGSYVADVGPADALHVTFVRSTIAHALIHGIDADEAVRMPDVVGVFTATDLGLEPKPPGNARLNQDMSATWLASDRVRYVGDPVAVVVSRTRAAGVDAAELVGVDYEPLPAVVSVDDSLADDTLLFPDAGTNAVLSFGFEHDGDLFADCEVTVALTFTNPRLSVAPIEPRAAVARWAPDGDRTRLTYWACTQFPHVTRDGLARGLGIEPADVHVITPDVGGGFGAKSAQYPEDMVVAWLARRLARPVRWVETRTECMLALAHGRAMGYDAVLGGTRDGDVRAYRLRLVQDAGGYPSIGSFLPVLTKLMATGVYDIGSVDVAAVSTLTNTTLVGAYRGAGRPEATLAIERMMDLYATEIGMDPAELRRRNFVSPDAFPFTTPTGAAMDTGEYRKALDTVLDAAGYAELRADQQRRLADPDAPLMGIGLSAYVEITNPFGNPDFGSIEIRPDGSALVLSGASSHGQGHHTAFAQLAGEVTGIPMDRIEVRDGDTDEVARGGGTGGSRSLQTAGCAVWVSAGTVVERAKDLAASMLEANPADIVLDTAVGRFHVAGTPTKTLGWAEIATRAEAETGERLAAESDFEPDGASFPFGVHLSVVEIDRETGAVTVLRHVACDDAGVIVNPTIVDGQVHGGVASGIAQALMEEFVYDDEGNPRTANLAEYALASAAELGRIERIPMETPTDRNPLGVKGIGEAGTIGSTPAVQNAVVDALSHLGVRHLEIPASPARVWAALQRG